MNELTRAIKEKALSLGFSACGIAAAQPLNDDREYLKTWLDNGFHGQMQYMERNLEKRADPTKLLEGAASVISLLYRYNPAPCPDGQNYKIAKYASGPDYHRIIKLMLQGLMTFISEFDETALSVASVDAAPVFDKRWAQRAGLGWIGKNTLLINPDAGSFCNIGEIITTLRLDYDTPGTDQCGNCRKCLDACPTHAITEGTTMNATQCIAYHTIEVKGDFDESTPKDFQGYIYGCDICQDVCPYNHKFLTDPATAGDYETLNDNICEIDWDQLSPEDFLKIFHDTPLARTGFQNIQRNIKHQR